MKSKILLLAGTAVVIWGFTAMCAYHVGVSRGYAKGAADECRAWTQEPTTSTPFTITGHRDMRALLAGGPLRPIKLIDNPPVSTEMNRPPKTASP